MTFSKTPHLLEEANHCEKQTAVSHMARTWGRFQELTARKPGPRGYRRLVLASPNNQESLEEHPETLLAPVAIP